MKLADRVTALEHALTLLGRASFEWDEDAHPRDDHGRFGGGGGGKDEVLDKVRPITAAEARGNSRPVSAGEFRRLAAEGRQRLDAMAAAASPINPAVVQSVIDRGFSEAQASWGGMTVDMHTGVAIESNADMYAVSVKQPGSDTVAVPEDATKEQFAAALHDALQTFGPELEKGDHYLGVFHDDDNHRIAIDPVVIVKTPHEVEAIGAFAHSIGGAYHFATGNGYFPPHVAETAAKAA